VAEDLTERLAVCVRKALAGYIVAGIRESFQIRVAHPGNTEGLELIETPNTSKSDSVVYLADLAQRWRRVLAYQQNSDVQLQYHDRSSAADALLGEICTVLDQLLRRYVERYGHGRPSTTVAAIGANSESETSSTPSLVTVTMFG